MTTRQAFTLVISTTLAFTTIGGLIGFFLGRFLPNYDRSVFSRGHDLDFDPLATGVGQGLTQGITAGSIIGVLLVIIVTWYQVMTRDTHGNRNA